MRAYYFDNLPGDQRLPHDCVPSRPVSAEVLEAHDIKFWHIPLDEYESKVGAIADERGYTNRELTDVSKEGLGEIYEAKIESYFQEHMHEEEEIRYVISGSGFFDVREISTEAWIRLAIEPGDLLVLPPGMYHRFTLDEGDRIVAMILSREAPETRDSHHRSQDTEADPVRIQYLNSMIQVGVEA